MLLHRNRIIQLCTTHGLSRYSAAVGAILADATKALPAAGAPHTTASTEEELAVAVGTTETWELRDVTALASDHASTLRDTLK